MRFVLLLACFAASSVAFGATSADDVLTKMDQAAPNFTALSADIHRITYTKVLDEKSTEAGTMLVRRASPRDLQVAINFTEPDAKTVVFRGKKAEIYYPKMKTVEEWDLGKHVDLVNQFLVLGFGSSGREIKAGYNVKYAGEETISNEKTQHLELTPKSAQGSSTISRIDLWVSDKGSYPVQQKIGKPSGDYYLFTYANVRLNPPLGEEALRLKFPKGTKRVTPQK